MLERIHPSYRFSFKKKITKNSIFLLPRRVIDYHLITFVNLQINTCRLKLELSNSDSNLESHSESDSDS